MNTRLEAALTAPDNLQGGALDAGEIILDADRRIGELSTQIKASTNAEAGRSKGSSPLRGPDKATRLADIGLSVVK